VDKGNLWHPVCIYSGTEVGQGAELKYTAILGLFFVTTVNAEVALNPYFQPFHPSIRKSLEILNANPHSITRAPLTQKLIVDTRDWVFHSSSHAGRVVKGAEWLLHHIAKSPRLMRQFELRRLNDSDISRLMACFSGHDRSKWDLSQEFLDRHGITLEEHPALELTRYFSEPIPERLRVKLNSMDELETNLCLRENGFMDADGNLTVEGKVIVVVDRVADFVDAGHSKDRVVEFLHKRPSGRPVSTVLPTPWYKTTLEAELALGLEFNYLTKIEGGMTSRDFRLDYSMRYSCVGLLVH